VSEYASGVLVYSNEPIVVERDSDRTEVAQSRDAERDQRKLPNAGNAYHFFREIDIPHSDYVIASD
jgi:hypothetical protein